MTQPSLHDLTEPELALALVHAVQRVVATAPGGADGDSGTLVQRVQHHMGAIDGLEATVQALFSEQEQHRLLGVLVDLHRDPLAGDQTLDELMSEL